MTSLHEAAKKINLAQVRRLLRQKSDPNAKDRNQWTPLHEAVCKARGSSPQSLLDIVEALLRAKANPNAVDQRSKTPLHRLHTGTNTPVYLGIVDAVLKAKADPNAKDAQDNTPLHLMVSTWFSLDVVRMVLEAKADPNARGERGETLLQVTYSYNGQEEKNLNMTKILLGAKADPKGALHRCVLRQDKPDTLIALLQAKADPHELNTNNWNALHTCTGQKCRCQQSETTAIAMVLLKSKVDPNALNDAWDTPLTLALRSHYCSKELVATLRVAMAKARASTVYTGPGDDELWQAAAKGNLARVHLLLRQGADPNERNAKEATPLHYAAAHGHLDTLNVLLRGKADPVIGALSLTLKHEYAECAKALLRAKADPNEGFSAETRRRDPGNAPLSAYNRPLDLHGSALFHTLRADKIDVAMELLRGKADVNIWTFDGTPLHWAAIKGKPNVTKAILQAKADPDKEGSYEMHFYAPLHYAAGHGNADCVEVLLQGKADPAKGLHSAAVCGHTDIAKTLLQGKADPSTMASFSQFGGKIAARSPLHRASAYCRVDCAKVLLHGQADPNATDEDGKTPLDVICTGEANWEMFRDLTVDNTREEELKVLLKAAMAKGIAPPPMYPAPTPTPTPAVAASPVPVINGFHGAMAGGHTVTVTQPPPHTVTATQPPPHTVTATQPRPHTVTATQPPPQDLTEEEILIKARNRANGLYAKDPDDPDKVVGFEDLKGLEVKDGLAQAMKMNSQFERPSKNMQDIVWHPRGRHLMFQRPNGSGKTGAIALAILRDLEYGPGTDYHQAVVLTNHSVNLNSMKETILRTGRYALGKAFAQRKPGEKVRESSVGWRSQVDVAIQSWRDPIRWPEDRPQPKVIVATVKTFYELLAQRKLRCKRVHTLVFDEADQTVTPVDLDRTPLRVQEERFKLFKKKILPDARVLMVSATFTPKFIESILTRTLLSRPDVSVKQLSRAISTFQRAHPGVTPAHWSEHKEDFERLQSAAKIDFDQELNTQRTIDLFYLQCENLQAKMKFCVGLRQKMVAESTERGAESVPRTLIFANTHAHCEQLMRMFNMQNAREGGDGNVAKLLSGVSKWRRTMAKSIGVDAARKLSYSDYEKHIQSCITALKAEGDPCQVLIATDVLNRGVDIDGLALVINLSPPLKGWGVDGKPSKLEGDLAIFEHRAGRCGRFGDPGVCVTLETCQDEQKGIGSLGDLRNPDNLPFRKMITRKNEGQDSLFQILKVRTPKDLERTTDDTMTRPVFQMQSKSVGVLVDAVVKVHSKLTDVLVEKERKVIVAAIKKKKQAFQIAAATAPAPGVGGSWGDDPAPGAGGGVDPALAAQMLASGFGSLGL